MTQFYDPQTKNSFGWELQKINTDNSEKYKCSNQLNCTSLELASLQWGNATVTRNPYTDIPNTEYTPVQDTMAGWGDYPIPGIEKAPEFSYYTSSSYAN